MKVIRRIADIGRLSGSVGFVPTMGALHRGHLSLIERARIENDIVVTSIFVNPTQFGKNEDLGRYPRPFENDLDLARSAGSDIVFAPEEGEMYGGDGTSILVNGLIDRWEGAVRGSGHFIGVATIVAKLFNLFDPTVSYFGLKDLQQCMVLRRMVEDLNMRTKLAFCPTVRESDGLAMSSRNAYLSSAERSIANKLYEEIVLAANTIQALGVWPSKVKLDSTARLAEVGFAVDYLDWVALPNMEPASQREGEQAIIVAAKLGTTRLIDSIIL